MLISINLAVPGPQYKLKSLVGFEDHCISKYRNPAYTMGGVCLYYDKERSPGPKYMIKERKKEGYSFGLAAPDYSKEIITADGSFILVMDL